jgi:hypothetical protein
MRSLIALALDEAEASDPSTLSVSRHGKMTVIDLEDFGQLTIVCEAGRLYAVAIPDVKPMLMPIGSLAKRLHRLLDKLDSEKD